MFFFITVTIFFSCEKDESKEKEIYEILNLVYPLLSAEISSSDFPPAPPPGQYISENKMNSKENFGGRRSNDSIIPQLIAVNTRLIDLKKATINKERNLHNVFEEGKRLPIDSINRSLLRPGNDSLMVFRKDLLEPEMKDYLQFDKLISFSEVTFNKDFNQAVLVGTVGTSSLAASSHIFFLQKVNGKWKLVQTELLEIS